MKVYVFLLFCGVLYEFGACSDLAPFITPCTSYDTGCMLRSAQRAVPYLAAGVPSMGIATMDPMYVAEISTNEGGLYLDFRNTYVYGLKNCQVLDIERYGSRTNLDLKCSVTMIGDYTLNGQLLVMPIQGTGKYTIKIRDIVVKITMDVNEIYRGGEQYWTLRSWSYTSHVDTGVRFHFHNLFNGNQELSQRVQQFANANWREIFDEVSPPIVKAVVSKIVRETTKLFNYVPLRDLVLQ